VATIKIAGERLLIVALHHLRIHSIKKPTLDHLLVAKVLQERVHLHLIGSLVIHLAYVQLTRLVRHHRLFEAAPRVLRLLATQERKVVRLLGVRSTSVLYSQLIGVAAPTDKRHLAVSTDFTLSAPIGRVL